MKIRRNNPGKKGRPGSYKMRVGVRSINGKDKLQNLEIGLGTDSYSEAMERADIVIRAFQAAGFRTGTRLEYAEFVEVIDNLAHWQDLVKRLNKGKIST